MSYRTTPFCHKSFACLDIFRDILERKRLAEHVGEQLANHDRSATDPKLCYAKVPNKAYGTGMYRLQTGLVKLQRWVKTTGACVVAILEERDMAGKGGTVRRSTGCLSPRMACMVTLPTPTEREKTRWYFQRYISRLLAAEGIVIFDRSRYNRARVEEVMGFTTPSQVKQPMRQCPTSERMLVESGIYLYKYWLNVPDKEQYNRFQHRLNDSLRQ